jgi:hypothetical protein
MIHVNLICSLSNSLLIDIQNQILSLDREKQKSLVRSHQDWIVSRTLTRIKSLQPEIDPDKNVVNNHWIKSRSDLILALPVLKEMQQLIEDQIEEIMGAMEKVLENLHNQGQRCFDIAETLKRSWEESDPSFERSQYLFAADILLEVHGEIQDLTSLDACPDRKNWAEIISKLEIRWLQDIDVSQDIQTVHPGVEKRKRLDSSSPANAMDTKKMKSNQDQIDEIHGNLAELDDIIVEEEWEKVTNQLVVVPESSQGLLDGSKPFSLVASSYPKKFSENSVNLEPICSSPSHSTPKAHSQPVKPEFVAPTPFLSKHHSHPIDISPSPNHDFIPRPIFFSQLSADSPSALGKSQESFHQSFASTIEDLSIYSPSQPKISPRAVFPESQDLSSSLSQLIKEGIMESVGIAQDSCPPSVLSPRNSQSDSQSLSINTKTKSSKSEDDEFEKENL